MKSARVKARAGLGFTRAHGVRGLPALRGERGSRSCAGAWPGSGGPGFRACTLAISFCPLRVISLG